MAKKVKIVRRPLNPSKLPGAYHTRVFVGGSYRQRSPSGAGSPGRSKGKPSPREILDLLREVVIGQRFEPILAAEFRVARPEKEIHHDALYLLHASKFAIFDLSEFSGALMEIDRAADYGTRCLILYDDPGATGWRVSWMLSSFVEEHHEKFDLHGYLDAGDARNRARNWLMDMRRKGYV
jgi:hypothetical protein